MSQSYPDFSPSQLQVALAKNELSLKARSQVMTFYEHFGYRLFWSKRQSFQTQLFDLIDSAAFYGLRVEDYQEKFSDFERLEFHWPDKQDSLTAEIRFTDVLIRFFMDVTFGNYSPALSYAGFQSSSACLDIISLLASRLDNSNLSAIVQLVELNTNDYQTLKKWISIYQCHNPDIDDITIPINSSLKTIDPSLVWKKFRMLGVLDSIPKNLSADECKEVLKKAQRLFGLFENGIWDNVLIVELNVSIHKRLEQLNRAINTVRWLRCTREQNRHVIVVNIPSATLLAYSNGKLSLESRIIVGKLSTRTPTLASTITEIVFYPYWMVPKKIAVNELLPLIKSDIGYLSANSMVLLNTAGKIVNPHAINWGELNSGYFPYTIRQSTGCDNSLGIVKLIFCNPYSVYLHDTPWKNLFKRTKRYFSHGCMRIEKAVELSKLILCDKVSLVDSLVNVTHIPNHPVIITLSQKVPVFVLYNTAWIDSTSSLHFYEDVYRKFRH